MDNNIKKRNTKQKQIIIDFLKTNKDIHLTAEQITLDMNKNKIDVSQATIYRLLNSLSEEGIVRKYFTAQGQSACYQFIEDNEKCKNHYHLICSECGRVIHFENELIKKIKDETFISNDFNIDLKRVSFYGTCRECS